MATYLILNVMFLILAITFWLLRRPSVHKKSWLAALGIMLLLTAAFDNLIIGASLVAYDESKLLGLHIGSAPIEDFFYTVVMMLIIPALWKNGAKHEDH